MELSRVASRAGRVWSGGWARVILAVPVLLVLLVFPACGTVQPVPTATTQPVDPREQLRRTVEQLTALQSVSFDLEHLVGSTSLLPGILMKRAYGSAVVPGRFHIVVEGELLFPRSYLEIQMIGIGGKSYMTNLVNGQWEEVPPEALPIDLGNLGVTLAEIVEQVQSPELLGHDRLDGIDVYHIGGDITSEVLKGLVPTAGTGFPVALEMWTDQETGILRQALIKGQVVLTDVVDSERRLTLSELNEPVTIEPPEL